MKTFKSYINEISGLRFIYENLKLNSGIGRKYLLAQNYINDEFKLKVEFGNLSGIIEFLAKNENVKTINNVCNYLQQVNDIHSTIKNIDKGRVLDDIELFEVKKFAILSQNILKDLLTQYFDVLPFHDLEEVIDILDPEKTRIPSFYIYSAYDPSLLELRAKQKAVEKIHPEEAEKFKLECFEIEDRIRVELSKKLLKYSQELQKNLDNIAYLDLLIAKAFLSRDLGLNEPRISFNRISYKAIFNPQVKAILKEKQKQYQPINIELFDEPCIITGANMSGKTVLLKTLALAQYMFQFGFYVPAESADMIIFDEVLFSFEDTQSELNGLSSFAVEILNINKIIQSVKKGKKVLVLVDELARTTNPEEGKALVSAFVSIMKENNVYSIVTTHYDGIVSNSKRVRVKGLIIDSDDVISFDNINDYMDYTLIEAHDNTVPTDAIRIAEILDADKDFIEKAKEYLK